MMVLHSTRNSGRKWLGALAALVGFGFAAAPRAGAQSSFSGGNAGSVGSAGSAAPRLRPEVQVVVAPTSGGLWDVSEVYYGQVPAAKAKERLANLLKIGGWTAASSVEFENAALDLGNVTKTGPSAPAPMIMSSVRCSLSGNVADSSRGIINVAPFVESLRDLNRVNIAFLSPFPAGTVYRGLEHVETPQATIDLAARQGTYLFIANIRDHSAAPLSLAPVDQTSDDIRITHRIGIGGSTLPFVFGLAIIVGLGVYFWATRLMSGSSARK